MKKVFLSFAILCAVSAYAQQAPVQQQPQQKVYTLQVTELGYETIMNALAELPAKASYALLTNLAQQKSMQDAPRMPAPPAGKDSVTKKPANTDKPKK